MFQEPLNTYVGRRVMRKSDAAQGTIEGLIFDEETGETMFELSFGDTIKTRTSVWEESDYKFM